MTEAAVRTRLWRDGVLEKEDFPSRSCRTTSANPAAWSGRTCRPRTPTGSPTSAWNCRLDKLAIEDAVAHPSGRRRPATPPTPVLTARALELNDAGELCDVQVSAFVLRQAFVTVHAGEWFDIDTIVTRWDENAELVATG